MKQAVSFADFVNMGRPHWRGQTSPWKALYFLLLGSPDAHTRLRNSYVLNEIADLQLPPDARVLEGGCGRAIPTFWLAHRHPQWTLDAIDLDPVMVHSCRRVAERFDNVTVREASILDLDVSESYDLIILIDTLEHIHDDVGLLARFRRALRPGGYLVVHVPRRHQQMWRWLPAFRQHAVLRFEREKEGQAAHVVIEGHVREEYTPDELRQTAAAAGFTNFHVRETIGKLGEVSFELNQLFWTRPALRYAAAVLTYPIAIPLGYLDVRRNPDQGNSLLLIARREHDETTSAHS